MKKILNIVGAIFLIVCLGSLFENCGGSNNSDSDKRSLTEMLDENDFAGANKYVANIFNSTGGSIHDIENKYLPAAIQTLKAEASYLMDQDDQDAETLFMLCINDVSGNIANYQPSTGFFDGEDQFDTDCIIEEVTPYNACLISIIREAIIKNKPDFAKKVLKMMKKNYKCDKKLKPGEKGRYVYDYTYNYTEDISQIQEAKKLISDYEAQQ